MNMKINELIEYILNTAIIKGEKVEFAFPELFFNESIYKKQTFQVKEGKSRINLNRFISKRQASAMAIIKDEEGREIKLFVQHHSARTSLHHEWQEMAYSADMVICCYPALVKDPMIREKTLFNHCMLQLEIGHFQGILSVKTLNKGSMTLSQFEDLKQHRTFVSI